jgi:anaphase-promoting complex subunit 8
MYFQRALRLDFGYLSAWTLMGHEYMELRNTAAAVQCYRSALNVSELDYRAWYGLGQTYEMLHLYQYAHYYFKKAAFLRPSDARMWSAVGNCLLKLGMKSEAIATYERAVNSGDREGIATRDLARLCRDENQTKRAAELFYKYLQCNLFEGVSNNEMPNPMPSTLEGLIKDLNEGATEDRLNFQDSQYGTIDNVSDSEQAEAILFLATYFKQSKEHHVAEFFCTR